MNLHLAKSYIKHQLKAKDEHSLHSPFVFEFYNTCLKNKSAFYFFNTIENYRQKLLSSTAKIDLKDLGAGSNINKSNTRKISDIAKHSLKQPFLAQQLFRIIHYLKPFNMIELGTSLGITTSYLASPYPSSNVYTLEGCPNTLSVAKQTFKNLSLKNIKTIEGDISNTLPRLIEELPSIDFVFFDGNHQYDATIEYFEQCKARANENTCFIFDDIYWSKDMSRAWSKIQSDEAVKISIDTFYFGICFFRTNQPKQHFILK